MARSDGGRIAAETEKPIRNVFIFIGVDPATQWLKDCAVALDAKGFVRTGTNVAPDDARSTDGSDRPPSLQSNVPGVFAVGDVRAGSVKRVGAAIGEGAGVVPQIHAFLENVRAAPSAQPRQVALAGKLLCRPCGLPQGQYHRDCSKPPADMVLRRPAAPATINPAPTNAGTAKNHEEANKPNIVPKNARLPAPICTWRCSSIE